ncbi:uL15 family ribosomal protein [Candidatus Woesearchaeota archaeon]|nr:uL15 family ribosomal protein [Candidatus Woesearchaeota archaeon]
MVVYKRKKVNRYRGHSNHGGGARKKRRGAGSRGGRGMAGTGKRAGQKKAGMAPVLGSHGFRPLRTVRPERIISVGYFTPERVSKLLSEGKATKEGQFVSIDLGKLGYTKLLGTGTTAQKLKLTVPTCSRGAAEKVKSTGGVVTATESAGMETTEKAEE